MANPKSPFDSLFADHEATPLEGFEKNIQRATRIGRLLILKHACFLIDQAAAKDLPRLLDVITRIGQINDDVDDPPQH